ncbi:MAG TPA: biotin--[acetyl-CoA-carboxylase] ligase [Lachnospiraceae bacterium]|nr:biotin--[acetyl-CoA-carboxylase] ligase [Lachnospiraceae bacterium]
MPHTFLPFTTISGQQLCKELGVSRTAVWKVMNRLKEEGYQIDSISNKGYRLISQPDVITKEAILSKVDTRRIARKVKFFDEVGSTNTVAKQFAEEQDSDGLLIVAEQQTQGKGRRGRNWDSPKGTGIFMSLILKPVLEPSNASMLTLVAALAVNEGIRKYTGLESFIKWPNDIVVNGKKVCGILTEMSTEVDYINHIVVGIGINVNMRDFPAEIQHIASSLALESGHQIHRAELIAMIMEQFEHYYEQFLETKDLSNFMDHYNRMLINVNREVQIITTEESYLAYALGINEHGHLLVRNNEGNISQIYAGEVSVRGLYGYT